MKIMHEQVSFAPRTMLKVKWDDISHFTYPWHYHSEFEIVYIIKSSGKRFVADSAEPFQEGDITMVGSNLPHFWKSEIRDAHEESNWVNAIVVQFHKDFFMDVIHAYPEFHRISELLKRAARGIHFGVSAERQIGKMLRRLLKMRGLDRMLYFLKLLDALAGIEDFRILASKAYLLEDHKEPNNRFDKIMHFINNNYQRKIAQEELATKIGMTTVAFCRYFKEKTGKGFVLFVNELRIGLACKLLIEGHLSISQVCYECGFNNISYFNRMFKRQTRFTPGEYQQQFIKAGV